MPFEGWPAEAIEFYEGLEADNSREYWLAHKDVYRRAVVEPFEELIAELRDEFGDARMFRPNRDVRFSADKSPYKTQAGALFSGGGYVQLSADGLGVGAGYYAMEPARLAVHRAAIDDDRSGAELDAIVDDLVAAGATTMAHDEVKRAPRGYRPDHPRIALLRLKGLAAWWHDPPAPWLGSAAAKEHIVERLRAGQSLLRWLDTHVGGGPMPGRA